MHDQLRDLGREIAVRQSPYRLWLPEQISKIQEQAKERLLIRGIKGETPFKKCMKLVRSSSREFSLSGQLKLLVVRENYFEETYFREEFATVWTGLVWLRWFDFKLRTLPSWLSLKNLSVLELLEAEMLEELWRDNIEPPLELRELIITGGKRFLNFPRSIVGLKHLKKIVLQTSGTVPLSCLPEEFCLLQSLEHLTLNGAELTSLPSRFGNLTNLRHLDLSGCRQLMMLPVSFKQLIHLEYINLARCSELTFTSENADIVENMTELDLLNFEGCRKLQELPFLTNQRLLRELDVTMVGLRELRSNIGELSKLEVLRIGSALSTSLPTSLGNLSSLTGLDIVQCKKLEYLPESIGNLSSLTRLTISECGNLEYLPESMGNLNLLQSLKISSTKMKSLPKALAQLCNLQHLSISVCPIKELDFESGSFCSLLYNLKLLNLMHTHVSRISISQQCCPSLETLHLLHNEHLTDIQTLPISLKSVALSNCKMLKSISGICGLSNLQKLVIEDCGKLDELPSFAELVSLETLTAVHTTWKMAAIQSWEHMERLRRVELQLACDISAIEHCLQSIKKWPFETIVWGRTEDEVDSLLNLFTFDTDFSLIDSCSHGRRLKSGQRRSSNAAVMLCFVINSFSEYFTPVYLMKDRGIMPITLCRMRVEKGKWVWIGISTDASWLMAEEYSLHVGPSILMIREVHFRVGGMLVMGKQERVVEGFYKLLVHLRKAIEG